jgi:hypothetical protein
MTAFAGDCPLWRCGDTNPVTVIPASATVIEVGDLLFKDPSDDKPKPASDMTDQLTEDLNQDAFQQFFLGVSLQRSRSGDTDPIQVATTGTFEFDCPSDTPKVGEMFGACEASSGTALEDKKVKAVASETKAIGRCAKEYASAVTKVWIKIKSTIMEGGVLAQEAGSSSGLV